MFFAILFGIIDIALLSFTVAQFYNVIIRGLPPFLPTQNVMIAKAVENIRLDRRDVVYELGCGRAKFLRNLAHRFPEAEYVGIEYSFLPYSLAYLQILISRLPVRLIKDNFFKIDLARATVLYFYLLPETMRRLSLKIKQECRPGTRVISYQFSLPDLDLERISIYKNKRLYFYRV